MTNKLKEARIPNTSVSRYQMTALNTLGSLKAGRPVYESNSAALAKYRNGSYGLGYETSSFKAETGRIKSGFWKSLKPTPGELDLKIKRLKSSNPGKLVHEDSTETQNGTKVLSSDCKSGNQVCCSPQARADVDEQCCNNNTETIQGRISDNSYSDVQGKNKGFNTTSGQHAKELTQRSGRVPYELPRTAAYEVLGTSSCWACALSLGGTVTIPGGSTKSEFRVEMDRSSIQNARSHTSRTRSAYVAGQGDSSVLARSQHRLAIRRLLTALSRSRQQDGSDLPVLERPHPANVIQPASRSLTLYNMSLYPELNKNGAYRNPASSIVSRADDWRDQLRLITWLRLLNPVTDNDMQREQRAGNTSSPDRPVTLPINRRVPMSSDVTMRLNGSKSYIKASSIPLEPKRIQASSQSNPRDRLPFPAIADKYKGRRYDFSLAPTERRTQEESFCRAPQNTPVPSLCSDNSDNIDAFDGDNDDDGGDDDDDDGGGNDAGTNIILQSCKTSTIQDL